MKKYFLLLLAGLGGWLIKAQSQPTLPASDVLTKARANVRPALDQATAALQVKVGAPIFIRIFKESQELEVWLQRPSREWVKFKTYPIFTWGGGTLGPKLAQGDGQAPEGFYEVGARQMNPFSSYHLAFNIGYPNAYDLARHRTGSAIMIHGAKVSIGCFAMTDPLIEEIYVLADAALAAGQRKFSVHSFPFRMTRERLEQVQDERWLPFWENLREGYDAFEKQGQVPRITMENGRYLSH